VGNAAAATSTEGSGQATAAARRSSVAETLRAETLKVTPRAATTVSSYSGGPVGTGNGAPTRSGTSTGGI
jgi:hypothetical protein